MKDSYAKMWVHAVWSTRDRKPFISNRVETALHEVMRNRFDELGCEVKIINGISDHVHCLFALNSQTSLARVVRQVKQSGSQFMNTQKLTGKRFAWQNGYLACSENEADLESVVDYIRNQKEYHSRRSFDIEHDLLLSKCGFGGETSANNN